MTANGNNLSEPKLRLKDGNNLLNVNQTFITADIQISLFDDLGLENKESAWITDMILIDSHDPLIQRVNHGNRNFGSVTQQITCQFVRMKCFCSISQHATQSRTMHAQ